MKNVKVGSTYYYFKFYYNSSSIDHKITDGELLLAKAKVIRPVPGEMAYSYVNLTDIINAGYRKNKQLFLASKNNLYPDLGAITKKMPIKAKEALISFLFEMYLKKL